MLSDGVQGTVTIDDRPITPVEVNFSAYVIEFDPVSRTIVGPVLYESAPQTVPLTDGKEFSPYTFSPNIPVTAGATYLLFLFANNFDLEIPVDDSIPVGDSRLRLGTSNSNVYPDGSLFIHHPADSDFASLGLTPWSNLHKDLEFSATFDSVATSVPEPGTLALLGLWLVAMVGVARRKPS